MQNVEVEFFNALYLRKQISADFRDSQPAEFGKGGVSDYFLWFPNSEGNKVVRRVSEIVGVSTVAVGSILPFRDIVYVKTVINRSEDPNDGALVYDICMCHQGYQALKATGLIESEMGYEIASEMKALFERYCEVKMGKDYKKELHTWLRQKNKTTV